MSRLTLLCALVAFPALAGERFLGIIVSAAGADTTNATTAAPFAIPKGQKITMACTAAAFVCAVPLESSPTAACTAAWTFLPDPSPAPASTTRVAAMPALR